MPKRTAEEQILHYKEKLKKIEQQENERRKHILPIYFSTDEEEENYEENDFYYTPVERSFAQVQPPLYPNNRPATYYDQDDSYRVGHPTIASPAQQPLYDGRVRFPTPNYNQNPQPFQLPTGRSQAGNQFYVNQPDFPQQQRQRFRLSLPHNYQIVHPASTKIPDISQIHSAAYQNDPSKPEIFLGQVTINNPDIDYLQNSRFKNIPFDGNSLKSNGQSHHGLSNDEDIDNDNLDLFDQHRVTTYNPNKLSSRQRIIKPNPGRFPHYEGEPSLDDKTVFQKAPSKVYLENSHFKSSNKPAESASYHDSSTEYKTMLDLEPLLEDDISDISSFRELMKNTKGSHDVQVIKSNSSEDSDKFDSNPSASSMDADNIPKQILTSNGNKDKHGSTSALTSKSLQKTRVTNIPKVYEEDDIQTSDNAEHKEEPKNKEVEDESEYVEYYDDETTEAPHTTRIPAAPEEINEYDEYDSTEEIDETKEEPKHNFTDKFDVLVMKPNNTMVKDDNFKEFVDTTVIDQLENVTNPHTPEFNTESAVEVTSEEEEEMTSEEEEEVSSVETPSILGQEIVSVVTTKSVVNGTISVPNYTYSPNSAKVTVTTESLISTLQNQNNASISSSVPVTTENWVVASVQTSRSVSGARFLPFPTVEQEEKKQVLTEDEENDETVTKNPKEQPSIFESDQTTSVSTENLNEKLDRIQSELSSAVLSGSLDDKNIEIITESTTTTTTTPASLNVFTLRSTEASVSTERSSPDPLPVMIKKFTPRVTTTTTTTTKAPRVTTTTSSTTTVKTPKPSTSTTPKPKKKLVTVMDELPAGLLPAGYRPRMSYKDKRTSTTTSTTSTTTESVLSSSEEENINGTQGRSSGISSKNKVIIRDDKIPYAPREFKPKETKSRDGLFSKVPQDDLSKLLPPGYKPPASETSDSKDNVKPSIFDKIETVDISAFLPKDFKPSSTTKKPKIESKLLVHAGPVDISAFLPPGFKVNSTENGSAESPLKIKIADISSLLPPGFKLNSSEESVKPPVTPQSTTKAPGGFKLVFPSRPGNKQSRKSTTAKPAESGPSQVTPKIQKGWPVRASTEFTGWPSPSTTPFSIEKLLEAQRNATATSPIPSVSTEATTRRSTTTTTTTQAPSAPTTPGICKHECDIAATIKIVAGVKWVPELLDHHTQEWQKLAEEVKSELNSVYSESDMLKKWYKGIRIDGFSKGSVLVDFFIELNDVKDKVDTLDLKQMFHKSLNQAQAGSFVEAAQEEPNDEFDPDAMLGDQPDEDRMKKSNEKMTKTIDKSAGKLEIGKFVMDPAYTEFIVLPKREEPTVSTPEEESFLPQWGIAVIVIALASLLFVVIFGVTVLVNRQKSSKAKQPIPLSEDMLRELDKSHMGGFDDLHQLKERELPYHASGKRMSTAFIEQLAYPNPGDSWRSEWTPQLQKYMQHYTPDSGRGSQIYGAAGNPYGYNGSQLYGQTGGGSQVYGYSGEGGYPPPRSHYSRRRSDYDSNF